MTDRNDKQLVARVIRGLSANVVKFLRKYRLPLLVLLAIVSGAVLTNYFVSRPRFSVTCFVNEETAKSEYNANDYEEDPEAQFLLVDQVIVTGPTSAVSEIVQGFVLTPTRWCDLSYRGTHNLDSKSFPFPPEALNDLTMRLYRIKDGQSVAEVVKAINMAGSDLHVFADPNYLTGPLTGASACGNPLHGGGGSPFAGISPTSTTAEWFWRQWAFEHIGTGSSLQDALQDTSINPTGAGVRIGVFDTSPFDEPPAQQRAPREKEIAIERAESVPWLNQAQELTTPLNLTVSYPEMRDLEATYPETATNVSDHGLFVAGLIHAIAPESDIQLIRVLNEYGCGDLFTLNKALYRFIAKMEAERGKLDGTVINLSLGVLKPASDDAESTEEIITIDPSLEVFVDDPVESLHAAVLLAHSRGAVVVAAAGNDSGDSDIGGKPLPPQVPARYPFVIGVAGSNVHRERACFSNWGDVSAPSGDVRPEEGCDRKVVEECAGDCDEAVVSLALSPSTTGTAEHATRYAYWRGTSFSAPLVSGLAALVLDAGTSRATCPLMSPAWVHPNQVHDTIRCGASTGDGVINVPASLFRCLP